MQQQQASAVPRLVQRLRRSIKHKDTQQQQQLIVELVEMTQHDPQRDANPVRLQVLQQTGICAALQQLLQIPKPWVPAVAMQLISNLGLAGPQAAEQITAQPGITAGLARLLQSSSAQASSIPGDLKGTSIAIGILSVSEVAAERLAAEPGIFAGLVGVLAATADPEAVRAAPAASEALWQLVVQTRSSSVVRMLQQQPGAIAALSELLNSDHSHESQGQALRVLHAVVCALSTDTVAHTAVVQQLAGQRGMLQNLVQLLRSKLHDRQSALQDNQGMQALSLLQVALADEGAKDELLATPRIVPALARMLDSKDRSTREQAMSLLLSLMRGGCRLASVSHMSGGLTGSCFQNAIFCYAASCAATIRTKCAAYAHLCNVTHMLSSLQHVCYVNTTCKFGRLYPAAGPGADIVCCFAGCMCRQCRHCTAQVWQ
jgi:hypothetical protein